MCSVYASPQVKILVGQDETPFSIHKDLLCHYSSYFRAALNGGFEEAAKNEIKLLDEDPQIFNVFLEWLYTGNLYEPRTTIDPNGKADEERTDVALTCILILKLWVFGDKRGAPKLQNDAVDALYRYVKQAWIFPSHDINYVYDNTVAGARLRAFVVDLYARVGNMEPYARSHAGKSPGSMDQQFLMDVCRRYQQERDAPVTHGLERTKKVFWEGLDICAYHVHESKDCKGRDVQKTVAEWEKEIKLDDAGRAPKTES